MAALNLPLPCGELLAGGWWWWMPEQDGLLLSTQPNVHSAASLCTV